MVTPTSGLDAGTAVVLEPGGAINVEPGGALALKLIGEL
jgi:hypothetical protein